MKKGRKKKEFPCKNGATVKGDCGMILRRKQRSLVCLNSGMKG